LCKNHIALSGGKRWIIFTEVVMRKKLSDVSTNPLIPYLGGIFDIGGCVRIEVPKKGTKASLYVWITSKNFELMEVLQGFGAYVSQKADGQYRAKWRDKRAYDVLRSITPYLHILKEQALCGIEFFEAKQRDPEISEETIFRLRLKLLKKEKE
jgi:hypothetical protein